MTSYQDAVEKLNTLQSNAATLEAVRASGGRLSQFAIPEMLEYLGRIGYTPEKLNKLNVIHITGTKGKGSTSAFTDSILRKAKPEWKVGLYTSPHLVAVRERIRINGVPISEELFAKYLFEVWNRLQENTTRAHESTSVMPGYFRFVTLLAFHAFLESKVDATVLEVGVGGTYDSTNIVPKPVVTAVSALGIDHVAVLGKTLEDIAWQKAGIYKDGVPALTVNQPESALKVLKERAQELKASAFKVIETIPEVTTTKLGLAGDHQIENANLAIHVVRQFLEEMKQTVPGTDTSLNAIEKAGLESTKWPGRCQQVDDPRRPQTTWFLDGAHTVESLRCCFRWFVTPGVALSTRAEEKKPLRVLVFNCTNGRSGESFLGIALKTINERLQELNTRLKADDFFDRVIFCTNVTYADGHFKGDLTTIAIPEGDLETLKTQRQLKEAWSAHLPNFPTSDILVLPSIEHAVRHIDSLHDGGRPVQVLVSGSLHLIGGMIEAAQISDVAL
ncbi:tetrahydrofolylpolyglutamate synthase [Coprinopsis cinerea okayama7|uniref:Folylpolyglutamate synthase n=1 Tax=Coprinopsis cinerea (strain Okayama-7 / 130 / ATCC MYA-4618 / FGSC 9003) TaxID=240176 RepID=A8NXW2_COPC7|nr:tetrahydrofolylpolyglutamate synthase [Coprinopsis cinerea okayama7\|eukprot:XP_001837285.2 tetrahydrofolylpolyglutamate synthase [Coprinopsis cinerea okayama7\